MTLDMLDSRNFLHKFNFFFFLSLSAMSENPKNKKNPRMTWKAKRQLGLRYLNLCLILHMEEAAESEKHW